MTQQSDQSNILRLYEELGVRPEHGVERLTERYRQRLRELHPDGRSIDNADAHAERDGIGWITRSYRDALAFEREHGRLPGAGGGGCGGAAPGAAAPLRRPLRRPRVGPGTPVSPFRQVWRWLVFAAALALLIAFMAPELAPLLGIDEPGHPGMQQAPTRSGAGHPHQRS